VRNPLPEPSLLVITDQAPDNRHIEDVVRDSLGAGCRWVMYRDKAASEATFLSTATGLVSICKEFGAILTVNQRMEVAEAVSSNSLHLQRSEDVAIGRALLGRSSLIGVSCHSIEDAQAAEAAGADYVTLSPIFETASKPGYGPTIGLGGLAEASAEIDIPLIALAGIFPTNVGDCLRSGADGVAVMGSVMQADNPCQVVTELLDAVK
tara:strand:+ start:14281 stop:14904 length:624 start_codon:yes stop_codon:yes gene_type:complete